jgi:hypothetical protein
MTSLLEAETIVFVGHVISAADIFHRLAIRTTKNLNDLLALNSYGSHLAFNMGRRQHLLKVKDQIVLILNTRNFAPLINPPKSIPKRPINPLTGTCIALIADLNAKSARFFSALGSAATQEVFAPGFPSDSQAGGRATPTAFLRARTPQIPVSSRADCPGKISLDESAR